jgi:hypothetical protein
MSFDVEWSEEVADIERQTVKVEVGEVHLMFKLMRILLYE